MGRRVLLLSVLTVLGAAGLAAQDFKAGDLMPRNGIIAYFTSDKADVFERMMGKNEKGESRFRAMMNSKSTGSAESPESVAAAKEAADFLFGAYDKTASFEMGFLDVTMGGAKFLIHLRAKAGHKYDLDAAVMKTFLKEEKTIAGFKVKVFQMPSKGKGKGPGGPGPGPGGAPGFDLAYFVPVSDGIVISNFETTITDSLTRLAAKDFTESLSSRPEFTAWRDERKPHDLSLFIVGRELQAAIERMMPSKDQVKRDISGAYSTMDAWLQLREYKSITIDFDYLDANGGIDIEIKLNTSRRTKLLEKLAVEPADFKLLGLLPANVTMMAGLQLGDAPTTFNNLVEFARDAEAAAKLAKKAGPVPPDGGPDKKPEDGSTPKDSKDEKDPRGDKPAMPEKSLENTLKKMDESLGAMGSSVQEVIGTLGTELIVFSISDMQQAMDHGAKRPDEVLKAGRIGAIIGLKDVATAKTIFEKARQKEGAMPKLETVEYEGATIYTTKGMGFVFTDNALLLVASPTPSDEKDAKVLGDLKSMLNGRKKAREVDPSITRCSKFFTLRMGDIAGMLKTLAVAASEACTRDAKPMMSNEWFEFFGQTTMTLRLNETKDSLALGLRVVGLPPIGQAFDGMMSSGKGAAAERSGAWGYAQSNARELARGLRSFVSKNDGATLTFDAAIKAGNIRAAHLQSPFDKNWKGSTAKLRYFSVAQVTRDKDGKLSPWVDAEAAAVVEENEKAGFVSFTLADGAKATINGYQAGFISAYQSSPDAFGGRVVLYGDDEIGWLSEAAFKKALELNKIAVAVPAPMNKPDKRDPPKDEKAAIPGKTDPWAPGGDKKGDKK